MDIEKLKQTIKSNLVSYSIPVENIEKIVENLSRDILEMFASTTI